MTSSRGKEAVDVATSTSAEPTSRPDERASTRVFVGLMRRPWRLTAGDWEWTPAEDLALGAIVELRCQRCDQVELGEQTGEWVAVIIRDRGRDQAGRRVYVGEVVTEPELVALDAGDRLAFEARHIIGVYTPKDGLG